nr:primosomal protein N' [Anaerolineae bacterium]
ERPLWRDSLADRAYVPSAPLTLTTAQAAAWQAIRAAQQPGAAPRPILLHGVTGSGKTEIYLYAMAEALAQGRQAIYCVPEIALTPQTIRRVAERFPGQVAVVHGSLSSGERYDTWRRARAGELAVIVGTRSALFTPLPDVGLIVLDEEHDHSYKHTPPLNPPFYHARTVAEEMMRLTGGLLLCGSATPAVETFYRAQRGEMQLLQLPGRIGGHRRGRAAPGDGEEARLLPLPPVAMVDMREELKQGHRSIFSRALQQALAGVLARQEQAILFLNRRGQATYVFCRDCGYVATCRRCDMPLTYHREGAALRCHHCGSTQPAPEVCPDCASRRVKYFGAGTQQVEEALRALFPPVRCLRWDADTADAPAKHEALLAQFSAHEADVLIGTQMIAKGLDVPLVTLVGVVNADPGLALPDFRAGERVFQVLTQVAGRAGRGGPGGQVILQTYQPEHPCLVAAAGHDYAAFYSREIAARRALGYPPFRRLARLLIQHTHPVQAQREAEEAAGLLQARLHLPAAGDSALIGPAPCFFTRVDRHYRWQVLLRSPDPLPLLRDLPLRPGWTLDIDPLEVL